MEGEFLNTVLDFGVASKMTTQSYDKAHVFFIISKTYFYYVVVIIPCIFQAFILILAFVNHKMFK